MALLKTLFIFIGISIFMCSCSLSDIPGIYKVEIQQGNLIEEECLSKLKEGMTKHQVLYVIGSPSNIDIFDSNRWEYLFYLEHGNQDNEDLKKKKQLITLVFKDNKLVEILNKNKS